MNDVDNFFYNSDLNNGKDLAIELSNKILEYWMKSNRKSIEDLITYFEKINNDKINDQYVIGIKNTLRIFCEMILNYNTNELDVKKLYKNENNINILKELDSNGTLSFNRLKQLVNISDKKLLTKLLEELLKDRFINCVESNKEKFYSISYLGMAIIKSSEPKWIDKSISFFESLISSMEKNGPTKLNNIVSEVNKSIDEDKHIVTKLVKGYINVLEESNMVNYCLDSDWGYYYYLNNKSSDSVRTEFCKYVNANYCVEIYNGKATDKLFLDIGRDGETIYNEGLDSEFDTTLNDENVSNKSYLMYT